MDALCEAKGMPFEYLEGFLIIWGGANPGWVETAEDGICEGIGVKKDGGGLEASSLTGKEFQKVQVGEDLLVECFRVRSPGG